MRDRAGSRDGVLPDVARGCAASVAGCRGRVSPNGARLCAGVSSRIRVQARPNPGSHREKFHAMKNSRIDSNKEGAVATRFLPDGFRTALLAGLAGLFGFGCTTSDSGHHEPYYSNSPPPPVYSQQGGYNDDGVEVLTRGPVHEAFAGVVSYNPEAGVMVSVAPPDEIEEIPPDERPYGNDVAWIPGYWAWDDEREDYLWVSGTWRSMPPGREWVAGYWRNSRQGHQWISGYWANSEMQETTYLPAPPLTLEVGANIDAPSLDYGWRPGCWLWAGGRYSWRTGYWAQGRADWVWIPAYYVWTPRGVIFVDGFWDYPVQRRGILFAPVHFRSRDHYSRRGYNYSPRIVVNLSIFGDHLFLRPSYNHYYFGDYYGSRYDRSGFFFSFSYQSSRRGYDPFFSYRRWENRRDRGWDNRFQASYQYRRENESARPPRTWNDQVTINNNTSISIENRIVIVAPVQQLATRSEDPVRFQPVARGERDQFSQRGRDVQSSREQRRSVEAGQAVAASSVADREIEPVKVKHERSPIVGKSARQLARNEAPPEVPQAPAPDPSVKRRDDAPGRRADARRDVPEASTAAVPPGRAPVATRDTRGPDARQQSDERANAAAANARDASDQKAKATALKERQDAEKRAKDASVKARLAAKEQQDAEKRTNDAKVKAQSAAKAQKDAEHRANLAAAQARDEEQRNSKEASAKAEQAAARLAADAAQKADAAAKAKHVAAQRAKDAGAKGQAAAKAKRDAALAAEEKAAKDSDEGAKNEKGKGKPGGQ